MVIGAGNALISVSLMIMSVAGSQILIVPVKCSLCKKPVLADGKI